MDSQKGLKVWRKALLGAQRPLRAPKRLQTLHKTAIPGSSLVGNRRILNAYCINIPRESESNDSALPRSNRLNLQDVPGVSHLKKGRWSQVVTPNAASP
jgi:hypothetical protein